MKGMAEVVYLVCSWLWSTWVKTPALRGADLLIASACLPVVNRDVYRRFSEGREVLLACPEKESSAYYGKIASMVRSVRPKCLTVVTIDGSPHCLALHASVNEAEYILGEPILREHYVLVNGNEVIKISPNAVRVARYLSVVNDIIATNDHMLQRLYRLSEEYRRSLQLKSKV